MEAGELRQVIYIQSLPTTQGQFGDVPGWQEGRDAGAWANNPPSTTCAWDRASITPISGAERAAGGAVQADTTHKVKMYYRDGISPKNRVKFGTRLFIIQAVINVEERNVELNLMCKELV